MNIASIGRACVAALTIGIASTGSAWAGGDDAPAFQIDAAHDGAIHFKKFKTPLTQKWIRDLGYTVSYPIVANDRVFVTVSGNGTGGYGTELYALNLKTGDTIWQQNIDGTYFISNPAYDNGRVFVLNFDGLLRAFDAAGGTLLWSYQLPDQYFDYAPPVAANGTVYCGEGTLYAVDEATGTLKWSNSGADENAVAVGGKSVFSSFTPNAFKYSAKGKLLWQGNAGNSSYAGSGSYYQNRLYAGDGTVFDSKTGNVVTTLGATSGPAAFWSSAQHDDFRLGLLNGQLSSVNVQTAQTSWTFSGDGSLATAPLVINDSVAVGSSTGMLYILDAATGAQLWSENIGAPISWTDEGCCTQPWTTLGAGDDALVVPAGTKLAVYMVSKRKK